jgi:cellulose synthase/poly-beta-1,6-N-acetylglucosamine synthase-like glycosyltransferase
VLITCCNEDIDVILDTVRAACCLDYPRDRFRVFVCDDGGSKDVQASVKSLPYKNVFYNARKKRPVKDYKAGNLNAGLAFSRSLPMPNYSHPYLLESTVPDSQPQRVDESKKPLSDFLVVEHTSEVGAVTPHGDEKCHYSKGSTFVAGLDADMIPEPHWRKRHDCAFS